MQSHFYELRFVLHIFHLLVYWVQCDGSWLIQVFCDEGLPLAAVCCCHRDSLQSAVRPVDVAVDPVHCNALWCLDVTSNHDSVVRGVTGHINLGAVRKEMTVETFTLEREIPYLRSSLYLASSTECEK